MQKEKALFRSSIFIQEEDVNFLNKVQAEMKRDTTITYEWQHRDCDISFPFSFCKDNKIIKNDYDLLATITADTRAKINFIHYLIDKRNEKIALLDRCLLSEVTNNGK